VISGLRSLIMPAARPNSLYAPLTVVSAKILDKQSDQSAFSV
jgi:hypothetical protein